MSRIVISKKELFGYICLIVFFLFEYKFFSLPSNRNSIIFKYNTGANTILKSVLYFLFILINIRGLNQIIKQPCVKSLLISFVSIIVSGVVSIVKYGNTVFVLTKVLNVMYIIIGTVFLCIVMCYILEIGQVINVMALFNIFTCTIYLLQAYIYNSKSIMFLTIQWNFNRIYLRNGRIRILESIFLILFSSICSFVYVFEGTRRKIFHLINVVLSTAIIWYVAQTRIIDIIYIICISVVFLYGYRGESTTRKVFKSIVVVIATSIAVSSLTSEIISYISEIQSDFSYTARYNAFFYYISMIPACILNGLNFIDYTNSPYYYYIHGPRGIYFTSDVGVVGTIAGFGLVTGILYIVLCVNMIKLSSKNLEYSRVSMAIMLIVICTSVTLSLFDYERYSLLVLIVTFITSIDYRLKNKERVKMVDMVSAS